MKVKLRVSLAVDCKCSQRFITWELTGEPTERPVPATLISRYIMMYSPSRLKDPIFDDFTLINNSSSYFQNEEKW